MKLKRKVSSLFKKRNATDVAVIGGGGGAVGGVDGGDVEPARRSILKKPPTRSPGIAIHLDYSNLAASLAILIFNFLFATASPFFIFCPIITRTYVLQHSLHSNPYLG